MNEHPTPDSASGPFDSSHDYDSSYGDSGSDSGGGFGAGVSGSGGSATSSSDGGDGPKRKPRARRSRAKKSKAASKPRAGADLEDTPARESSSEDDAPKRKPATRKKRTRRKSTRASDEASESSDSSSDDRDRREADGGSDGDSSGSSGARRKRTRTRRKKTSTSRSARDEDSREETRSRDGEDRERSRSDEGRERGRSDEGRERGRSDEGRERGRSDEGRERGRSDEGRERERSDEDRDRDRDDEDGDGKKRRRRGSRGGRRRKKVTSSSEKSTKDRDRNYASRDGAAVDSIPGEEDELPASTRGRAQSKKKGRRTSTSTSTRKTAAEREESAEEKAVEAEALRTDVIYINAADPEEKRVAVVGPRGRIDDLLMTSESQKTLVSDIYRGRVVNLEPAIGAAFVDFGQGRNGFLHTSDVLPVYGEDGFTLDQLLTASVDPDEWDSSSSPSNADNVDEHSDDEGDDSGDDRSKSKSKATGRRKKATAKTVRGKKPGKDSARSSSRRRARLPINDLLKVGDQVVVQVTKDAIGDKGPTLTTYISIPGRYLVLMPSMARTGVSRKIPDDKERRRLKRILTSLKAPTEMGVIVRTAGVGKTKTDLQRDLDYLLGVWETFDNRLKTGRGPAPLYQESDVAIRTLRDLFNKTTKQVLVDDPGVLEQLDAFAERLMPEHRDRIQAYKGDRPIFHEAGIEQDFERIFTRRVELASGGSVVFDQAEALVAIDVNSGRTRTDSFDFEEIALKTNMEAVPEIALQIRLRDLGGIIVCDFIDMMKSSSNLAVERALRSEFSGDRARSKLGRISQFGLLEMTRQRLGPGTHKKVFQACPRCRGTARIRTVESRAQAILRRLGSALTQKGFSQVEVRAHPEVCVYLKERLWDYMRALEHRFERELKLTPVPDQPEDSVLRYLRADGREVRPGGRRKR